MITKLDNDNVVGVNSFNVLQYISDKSCHHYKGSCQKNFFWDIFPKCGWVGWLFPKQGPNL